MSQLQVAASTFPFLYSMSGLEALRHLHGMGYRAYEMMIFPPHCWPPELSAEQRREYKAWLDGEGGRITSFCYPLLDNNPNSVDKLMRDYTLDRYREAIRQAQAKQTPGTVARAVRLAYETGDYQTIRRDLPEDIELGANYPNPFSASTAIRFALPSASHVNVVVYDALGRQVRRLLDQSLAAGPHEVAFEAGSLPSGLYIIRIAAGASQGQPRTARRGGRAGV